MIGLPQIFVLPLDSEVLQARFEVSPWLEIAGVGADEMTM